MAKLEVSLALEQQELDWLKRMSEKYSLPTADKALRIAILYAKQVHDSAASTVKELSSKQKVGDSLVTGRHSLDGVHLTFLEEFTNNHNLTSKDQAVHLILEYCMTYSDEATIFEVKRCRHGDTCKNC